MNDTATFQGMTKRQFLKCSAFGVCGIALAGTRLNGISSMAKWGGFPNNDDGLWKWSKEAMFYERHAGGVSCLKCPHACQLADGETGICRNRMNYRGKMYTIAYGNPCAVHIDPIEKKPLFHFLPSTRAYSIAAAGCNFACLNCQNWEISQVSPKDTINDDLMPDAVVRECAGARCESIAYTYAEPTSFYEYAYDTAALARARGIKNVWKSNGYINETPLRKLCAYLDAANIDLKSFDDDIYMRLSNGHLAPVLRTLKVFHEENVWLEITNLVIPGWTDNLDMIAKMSEWLCANEMSDTPLHFTRFMPLYKLTQLPTTPVSTLEKAREIARKAGMRFVYIGNVPGHEAENTYCPACGKLLIERKGFSILRNDIAGGKCKFCKEKIEGVWT